MCMNCGCGRPFDKMGNDANITYDQLEAAAKANDMDPETAADNIHALAKQIRDQGMPAAS
jgi:hypothetical protein